MPSSNDLELQNALVLHTRPYQNTSLLVDFFTEKNGIIRCVAKGQRSKKNASKLTQFCVYQISFGGKSDLKTLLNLDVSYRHFLLKKEALYSGFYINEILLRVLFSHDPHAEIFHLSLNTFEELEQISALPEMSRQLEIILRKFEFNLLKDIGYLVDMRHDCHTGDLIKDDAFYSFDKEHGFFESFNQRVGEADFNRKLFSGKTIQLISEQRFFEFLDMDIIYRNEAKLLSRLMLAPYLGDKPLQSKTLFLKPN